MYQTALLKQVTHIPTWNTSPGYQNEEPYEEEKEEKKQTNPPLSLNRCVRGSTALPPWLTENTKKRIEGTKLTWLMRWLDGGWKLCLYWLHTWGFAITNKTSSKFRVGFYPDDTAYTRGDSHAEGHQGPNVMKCFRYPVYLGVSNITFS